MNAVAAMGIGINLGNTLDAPTEGEWALAAEEYYIQAFKDAKFGHVRIPVTWNSHVELTAPYKVDEDFMNRVELIVDWAIDRDLYVILYVHHDDWLKKDFDNIVNRNRFDSIWLQVSERFKHKSARLIFEILNEPHNITIAQLNTLNKRALTIIRNQTENRLVAFAGSEYSNLDALLAVDIPDNNDKYLMGNYHSYDPWNFAGMCVESWGTDNDKQALKAIYQKASDWSSTNNIPVTVNEFGSAKYDFEHPENICDQSQREAYIRAHVQFATEFGIAATFWDDGGSFSTYDRAEDSWGPEKDILVGE
jgi:endoglucanase